MDGIDAKKKRVLATATFCFACGIICFILRTVNERDGYYYYGQHNGLLMGGAICTVFAILLYVYAVVLHTRSLNYLGPIERSYATPRRVTPGLVSYPSPQEQQYVADLPPGYQQSIPQSGAGQFNFNEPPPPYTEATGPKRY